MNPPPVLLGFLILWNGRHKVVNPDLQRDAMEWFPALTKVWRSGLSWLSCLGYGAISKPNLHIKQSYCLPWKCRAHTSEHWPRRTWVRARWGQASEECRVLWVEGYGIARWFAAVENTKLARDNWIEWSFNPSGLNSKLNLVTRLDLGSSWLTHPQIFISPNVFCRGSLRSVSAALERQSRPGGINLEEKCG